MDLVLYALTAGSIIGLLSYELTCRLIAKRAKGAVESRYITGKNIIFIWMAVFAFSYALIAYLKMPQVLVSIEYMIVFSILACITVTDQVVQKIPNEMLLLLIVSKIVFIIIHRDFNIVQNLIGCAAGLFLFILPSLFFKINMGMGDIKFAAVIGLYLGIGGLLQTIIIMAVGLGLYTAYLYITKKGSVKSSAPIGPYLSLGMILTSIFPVININI